jgi:hypothetical protein
MAGSALSLLTYAGPVSNEAVMLGFRQHGGGQPGAPHRRVQQER